jgi:hypothetical protein
MWKTTEGSTGRLVQLCIGYFLFYVVTGVTVKYFTGSPVNGFPGMKGIEFLTYSTFGGTVLCLGIAVAMRWYRLESNGYRSIGPVKFPGEFYYIIPSGVCTAIVIPTTTLMYLLPISVMVAMVIMRASVIVISRIVDAVQIRQGILKRNVYAEENWAVVFALLAAGVNLAWVKEGDFDFVHSPEAVVILGSYIVAYAIRIYIMNYYKNTRATGIKLNNRAFFAIEQIAASTVLAIVAIILLRVASASDAAAPGIHMYAAAVFDPRPEWFPAVLAGGAFGAVAFFSVFIFMYKGRTATFAGLVNRLTSLTAGIAATLTSYFLFKGEFPKVQDWVSLLFILIAVGFLTVAERKRGRELATTVK